MSVFEAIAKEIELLKTRPDLEVLRAKAFLVDGFAEKEASLRRLTAGSTDVECPDEILTGLEIDTELAVYWKHRSQADVAGEFILPSPFMFLDESRLDPVFLDEVHEGIQLRQTRTVDYAGYSGRGSHALLEVRDGKIVDEVLLFDERRLFRMGVRYLEYVSLVRLTRGIEYWQLLYCEGIERRDPRVERIGQGLQFLSREFAGDDYSDLFARLKALSG